MLSMHSDVSNMLVVTSLIYNFDLVYPNQFVRDWFSLDWCRIFQRSEYSWSMCSLLHVYCIQFLTWRYCYTFTTSTQFVPWSLCWYCSGNHHWADVDCGHSPPYLLVWSTCSRYMHICRGDVWIWDMMFTYKSFSRKIPEAWCSRYNWDLSPWQQATIMKRE